MRSDIFVTPLEETDSSSNYLLEMTKGTELPEFASVITRFQTSGKGQRGNRWVSDKDKNLLFSFLLLPGFLEAKKQFYLSKTVSLGVKEGLDRYVGDITIKWPNDIYWKDKKICGTLIENDIQGTKIIKTIVGIGINVNQESFDSSVPNPVSLFNIAGHFFDKTDVFYTVMENIRYYYDILKEDRKQIDRLYPECLYRKDGFHAYRDANGSFYARIIEVLPEGFLVLEDERGKIRQYAFKEVEYLWK